MADITDVPRKGLTGVKDAVAKVPRPFLIIAVGGVGYYIYKKRKTNTTSNPQQDSSNASSTPVADQGLTNQSTPDTYGYGGGSGSNILGSGTGGVPSVSSVTADPSQSLAGLGTFISALYPQGLGNQAQVTQADQSTTLPDIVKALYPNGIPTGGGAPTTTVPGVTQAPPSNGAAHSKGKPKGTTGPVVHKTPTSGGYRLITSGPNKGKYIGANGVIKTKAQAGIH